MDPKSKGNKAYQEKRWNDAVNLYTQALALDPGLAAAYSNRAACWIQLHEWAKGMADCDAGLDLKVPSLAAKLYYRKAVCEKELGLDYSRTVKAGLTAEPHNQSLLDLASSLSSSLSSSSSSSSDAKGIEIKIVDTLPPQFTTKKAAVSEFQLPKLPLTYAGVQSLVRHRTPQAMDFVYHLDPAELVNAHKGIGIDSDTIDYVNDLCKQRGGEQAQRLQDALRSCDGYDAVSFLTL